ncbi:GNAT family N-acetyltransferase [Streptomyces sp. NBC_01142]|uniref:GNAT family N-acetyltransferase n=1 Tax=Streptomyces sp. NBC_01142 TaxID=2975865 RepID=UPI00225227B0|nr:GNAT family N-acetyltransferase [Streptomyces sp. NBC_01142]MCX4826687.1 GNAT family N-acetyltransferase [Streptomyces sp. NBC_01142]
MSTPSTITPAPSEQTSEPESPFTTRPANLGDLARVNALHHCCSLDTRYARYASGRRELKMSEFARLVHPAAGSSWLTTLRDDPETAVALTHLLKTRTTGAYELALLVGDPWQGQGLGSWLTDRALRTAAADPNCHTVTAMFGAGNRRALRILRRRDITIPTASAGVIDITLPLPERS